MHSQPLAVQPITYGGGTRLGSRCVTMLSDGQGPLNGPRMSLAMQDGVAMALERVATAPSARRLIRRAK